MNNEIDYKLMKKKIEEARKLSMKLGLTKTNEDGKLLLQMITGLEPTKENWKKRKEYEVYNIAIYAYGAYSLRGRNNWEEYKKYPHPNSELLKLI